jgi:ABC-type transport system substrate-binding protein
VGRTLLYKYHNDQNDIRGNLATSWDVSEDGMTWVFQIKDNAYFTSGRQVNAEAFVKSWDAAKKYQPRLFAPVKSYEATEEFELTVRLSNPSPSFIYDLPMLPHTGVVDPELLRQYGPEDNRAAVGCGPYFIENRISGERIILKANPNYHNPDKQPSIETINLVIIPDENTALLSIISGDIDAVATVNIEVYNSMKAAGGINIKIIEDRNNPFWFNAREVEIFRDNVVREALCHMLDWQALSDMVYDGLYPAPSSYFVGTGGVPYSDKYSYDPELGIKMLEDAGYKKDDIAFTMLADPDFTNLEVAMQGQFQALGFNKIETVTYDGATCYGMLKSGEFEMFPVHDGYSPESPLTPYAMGLIPTSTQRVMWLDYIDKAKYEKACDLYFRANIAPNFTEFVKLTEELTNLVQEECLALGGLQVMRVYGIDERFDGVYIQPVVVAFDFCYLWDTSK